RPLPDLVLHRVVLRERAEPVGLHRRVVHEHVLAAVVRRDEAVPLRVVEPLHFAARHVASSRAPPRDLPAGSVSRTDAGSIRPPPGVRHAERYDAARDRPRAGGDSRYKRAAMSLVVADALSLRHGRKILLDEESFGLSPGDRVGLVGPNGSGKSSLLKMLA